MKSTKASAFATLVAAGLLGASVQTRAVTPVTVTMSPLGAPAGTSAIYTSATSINENGQITGTTQGFANDRGTRAYIWTPTTTRGSLGTFQDLGNINNQPYGGESHGLSINNLAAVCGYYSINPATAPYDGFRYSSGAIVSYPYYLPYNVVIPGGTGAPFCYATGINDSGVVTGWATSVYLTGPNVGVVIYRAFGGGPKYPICGDTIASSFSSAINNFGQIVGQSAATSSPNSYQLTATCRACLWQPGQSAAIDLGFGDNSGASSIDSNGDVVGWSVAGEFLWTPTVAHGTSGTVTYLNAGAGYSVTARHINDNGQIVGNVTNASDVKTAFVYDSVHGFRTLQAVVGGVTKPISDAFWINNHGQIVGAYYDSSSSSYLSPCLIQPGY